MKPEEIDIFKDIRAVLSEAIDKLESLNAVREPREWWVSESKESIRKTARLHKTKKSALDERRLHGADIYMVREVIE